MLAIWYLYHCARNMTWRAKFCYPCKRKVLGQDSLVLEVVNRAQRCIHMHINIKENSYGV